MGGPERTAHYDPSYGYEVYWEDGNWIYDPVEVKHSDMCETKCNIIYRLYGRICGRNKDFEHKTFDNYCDMREIDCNNTKGWLIAYRGECKGALRTYPTQAKQIVTRAMKWLSNYSERYNV